MSGEGTEEGIACAGGIGDFGERECGAAEEIEFRAREGEFRGWRTLGMFGKQDGAEFAELDDDVGRTFIQKDLSGDDEIGSFAEIPCFRLVDHEEVDFFEDFMEVVVGDGDPEIHGIGSDERFRGGELLDHLELVDRVHVRKNHHR